MNKHTPGPWRSALKSEKTWHVGVYTASGEEVAHVAVKSALSSNRRDADARLIAAAPDLYALLRELIDIEGPQPGTADWARKVQAALARVDGESSKSAGGL